MTRVAAAVVQAAPVAFDVEATVAKLQRLISDAAAGGAGLVVFPEAFVSCYPRGITFGATVGARSPEGRAWFRRYWESSVDVPGPVVDRLGAIARKPGVYLVIGVIERVGGTLYCTALFLGPDGALLGKHRKLMPTAAERLVWGYGDGSTLPVLDTAAGRLGAVICWENYMPLLRMAMYAKGVQIWCAPTADARDTWIATMQHIACEGRCFVLSANQFATRGDYPSDYPLEHSGGDAGDVLCRGGSVIVSPLGEILAGPAFGEETVLRADLDLDRIAEAKYDFDVVGHYARARRLHPNRRRAAAAAGRRARRLTSRATAQPGARRDRLRREGPPPRPARAVRARWISATSGRSAPRERTHRPPLLPFRSAGRPGRLPVLAHSDQVLARAMTAIGL